MLNRFHLNLNQYIPAYRLRNSKKLDIMFAEVRQKFD